MSHPEADNDEQHKPGNWWTFGEINPRYDRSTWRGLYRCIPANDDFPAQGYGRGAADDWE